MTTDLLGKLSNHAACRIDFSTEIFKPIRGTEKNMETVCQRGAGQHWIRFFDEADAPFGKCTMTSDAHDRFAKLEVSYLLQCVADFPGLVVLATNLRAYLDKAFSRRFQSIIHFLMPRPREPLRLWRKDFPVMTQLHETI